MNARWLSASCVGLLLAATAAAQTPPSEAPRPEPQRPVSEPVTAEARFKAAEALWSQGQPGQAIQAMREGLALAPDNAQAPLRLVQMLLEQRRSGEAVTVLRALLQRKPTASSYELLLRTLQSDGSPIERAMTADEAVARFPGQTALIGLAVEALLGVKAVERAATVWKTLAPPEQKSPRGQWLLGGIHEAGSQPALAYAAYQTAASAEPKAQAALQRLALQSVTLSGQHFFAPTAWVVQPGTTDALIHTESGTRATLALLTNTPPLLALQQTLARRLGLPPEALTDLQNAANTVADAQAKQALPADAAPPKLLSMQRLACAVHANVLCLQVGPAQGFMDLFPTLQVAALALGKDSLVWLLEGAAPTQAAAMLSLLTDPRLLTPRSPP